MFFFSFERQVVPGRDSQRGAHHEEPRLPRLVQGLLPYPISIFELPDDVLSLPFPINVQRKDVRLADVAARAEINNQLTMIEQKK